MFVVTYADKIFLVWDEYRNDRVCVCVCVCVGCMGALI